MRKTMLGVLAAAFVLVLAAAAVAAGPKGTAKAGGGSAAFTNFEVSSTPPSPVGTTCPGAGPACTNIAAEPAIRADGDGNFYASSENGLGAGTDAWRSSDGGLHYATLPCPDCGSTAGISNTTGVAPGGGDTDLAVAPDRNPATGKYNVYVASLSLANVDISISTDGGQTFTLNPITTPETADDREWIAADGAFGYCFSYHDAPQGITVGCGKTVGSSGVAETSQYASALDATHAFQIGDNEIGNLAIDPSSHVIYQTYSAITTAAEATCAPQLGVSAGTCNYHGVYMAVSTDGGLTFTDYPVYVNPDATVGYGHQFVNVSVDAAGNVYSVYTDDHHVYYSFSTDHGQTWSGPYLVSDTSGTQIFPWSTAGDAGKLDVVYYQTPYYDGTSTPDTYPASAAWTVGFAQNLNALAPGSSWSRQTASPVNHYGGVCEAGVTCTGNRDLYDDFGVAASPTTGLASIVYSDDQYSTDAASTNCTPANDNTASCDHTSFATQTAGTGIYSTAGTGPGKHKP
ncbi:MAG TPA: sialidase family protein [Gaiellaceae bacterium]|nr:sialidase family protein [Gaiellaceae bacterium]